jgi:transposase-like protein
VANHDTLISVVAQIGAQYAKEYQPSRALPMLSVVAREIGVTKQAVSLWMANGVPFARRNQFKELLLKYGIRLKDGEFDALFAPSGRKPPGEPNDALVEIIERVTNSGYKMEDFAERLGLTRWTLRRCAKHYGGLPQGYQQQLRAVLRVLGITIDAEMEGLIENAIVHGEHSARSLAPGRTDRIRRTA